MGSIEEIFQYIIGSKMERFSEFLELEQPATATNVINFLISIMHVN